MAGRVSEKVAIVTGGASGIGRITAETLAAQARALRTKRGLRAEQLARQAAVKMVIPMSILMLLILALVCIPLGLDMAENGL